MKKMYAFCIGVFLFFGCASNPLTGRNTMAFVNNSTLFPMAFSQYDAFLSDSTVITNTAEADMVARVGEKIAEAAGRWLTDEGHPEYLNDYRWEYNLVKDSQVNAWCMPGGKIVVYTGILPLTQTEEGLAVVLGHEVSHAILNHSQQRMSAEILQQLGAQAISIVTESDALLTIYGVGSTLFGTLPFSRKHESEADHYGLILMALAGYNPDAAAPFWERMAAGGGGGTLQFLSTHPSSETRAKQLRDWTPEALQKAAEYGITF